MAASEVEVQPKTKKVKNYTDVDSNYKPSKHVTYLKNTLGAILPQCLHEVCQKRPRDPIEFIALCLYKSVDCELYFYEKAIFSKELQLMALELKKENAVRQSNIEKIKKKIAELKVLLRGDKKIEAMLWMEARKKSSLIAEEEEEEEHRDSFHTLPHPEDEILPLSPEITTSGEHVLTSKSDEISPKKTIFAKMRKISMKKPTKMRPKKLSQVHHHKKPSMSISESSVTDHESLTEETSTKSKISSSDLSVLTTSEPEGTSESVVSEDDKRSSLDHQRGKHKKSMRKGSGSSVDHGSSSTVEHKVVTKSSRYPRSSRHDVRMDVARRKFKPVAREVKIKKKLKAGDSKHAVYRIRSLEAKESKKFKKRSRTAMSKTDPGRPDLDVSDDLFKSKSKKRASSTVGYTTPKRELHEPLSPKIARKSTIRKYSTKGRRMPGSLVDKTKKMPERDTTPLLEEPPKQAKQEEAKQKKKKPRVKSLDIETYSREESPDISKKKKKKISSPKRSKVALGESDKDSKVEKDRQEEYVSSPSKQKRKKKSIKGSALPITPDLEDVTHRKDRKESRKHEAPTDGTQRPKKTSKSMRELVDEVELEQVKKSFKEKDKSEAAPEKVKKKHGPSSDVSDTDDYQKKKKATKAVTGESPDEEETKEPTKKKPKPKEKEIDRDVVTDISSDQERDVPDKTKKVDKYQVDSTDEKGRPTKSRRASKAKEIVRDESDQDVDRMVGKKQEKEKDQPQTRRGSRFEPAAPDSQATGKKTTVEDMRGSRQKTSDDVSKKKEPRDKAVVEEDSSKLKEDKTQRYKEKDKERDIQKEIAQESMSEDEEELPTKMKKGEAKSRKVKAKTHEELEPGEKRRIFKEKEKDERESSGPEVAEEGIRTQKKKSDQKMDKAKEDLPGVGSDVWSEEDTQASKKKSDKRPLKDRDIEEDTQRGDYKDGTLGEDGTYKKKKGKKSRERLAEGVEELIRREETRAVDQPYIEDQRFHDISDDDLPKQRKDIDTLEPKVSDEDTYPSKKKKVKQTDKGGGMGKEVQKRKDYLDRSESDIGEEESPQKTKDEKKIRLEEEARGEKEKLESGLDDDDAYSRMQKAEKKMPSKGEEIDSEADEDESYSKKKKSHKKVTRKGAESQEGAQKQREEEKSTLDSDVGEEEIPPKKTKDDKKPRPKAEEREEEPQRKKEKRGTIDSDIDEEDIPLKKTKDDKKSRPKAEEREEESQRKKEKRGTIDSDIDEEDTPQKKTKDDKKSRQKAEEKGEELHRKKEKRGTIDSDIDEEESPPKKTKDAKKTRQKYEETDQDAAKGREERSSIDSDLVEDFPSTKKEDKKTHRKGEEQEESAHKRRGIMDSEASEEELYPKKPKYEKKAHLQDDDKEDDVELKKRDVPEKSYSEIYSDDEEVVKRKRKALKKAEKEPESLETKKKEERPTKKDKIDIEIEDFPVSEDDKETRTKKKKDKRERRSSFDDTEDRLSKPRKEDDLTSTSKTEDSTTKKKRRDKSKPTEEEETSRYTDSAREEDEGSQKKSKRKKDSEGKSRGVKTSDLLDDDAIAASETKKSLDDRETLKHKRHSRKVPIEEDLSSDYDMHDIERKTSEASKPKGPSDTEQLQKYKKHKDKQAEEEEVEFGRSETKKEPKKKAATAGRYAERGLTSPKLSVPASETDLTLTSEEIDQDDSEEERYKKKKRKTGSRRDEEDDRRRDDEDDRRRDSFDFEAKRLRAEDDEAVRTDGFLLKKKSSFLVPDDDYQKGFLGDQKKRKKRVSRMFTPIQCEWYLDKPRVLVCRHPILGEIRSHQPVLYSVLDTPYFWDHEEFNCQVFYEHEIYSVCDPRHDDPEFKDRMMEWHEEDWA